MIKILSLKALALTLLLLGACTKDRQDAELRDYLQRLSRPLGLPTPEVVIPRSPSLPRSEALRLTITGSKLDGLDFLSLSGCALQQTVAKRNSSLGKLAPPSQRLLLELAFLRDAPACVDTLINEGKHDLAAIIEESMRLKKSQLPALIFNATLGNREYRDFWRARDAPGDYPQQTSSLVITALERVTVDATRWLSGDYQYDELRFELALSDIARGDGGELLSAFSRQSAYLTAANNLIARHIALGPLCTDTLQSPAAPILRAVVGKFFVDRVQARSAALSQRFYQLAEPLTALESALSLTLPQDYRDWQTPRSAVLEQGLKASANHVKQLQSLLGSCYAEFAAGPAISDE
ncbi:MAG: DUF3080 domain-containing protein [Congregibacter sp.]|nr:DUF3080 domain-containing protein [Congregibacter sp.]